MKSTTLSMYVGETEQYSIDSATGTWGIRRLLAIFNYGGMPSQLVMRSMERSAREVMPAFVIASPDAGVSISTELRG